MQWPRFLALASLGIVAFLLLPYGLPRTAAYLTVACASVLAFLVRWRGETGAGRSLWGLLCVGLAWWLLGDVIVALAPTAPLSTSVLTATDVCYLIGYAFIVTGLVRMGDDRGRLFGLEEVLECSIVAVGVGLALWIFVVSAGTDGSVMATLAAWPAVAYTTIDAFLLTMLIAFLLLTRASTVPFWLAFAGVVALTASDIASYVVAEDASLYQSTLLNALWLVAYVCFGTVALHRSHGPEVDRVDRESPFRFGHGRFAGLCAAVLMTPVVMAIQLARGVAPSQWGWVIVLSSLLVIILVGARVSCFLRTLREQAAILEDVARTDPVTSLANRRLLREQLDDRLAAPGEGTEIYTLIVDVDRFAQINETFGYNVGDSVLREIGRRLLCCVREDDMVARLGGDQFVVVLCRRPESIDVLETASGLQYAVSRTMFVHDINVALDSTIGFATTGEMHVESIDAESMLQRAHVALTAAKASHSRVAKYEPTMDRDRHDQMRLLGELETAIRERQLRVFFQPCLDLESGTVDRVEALLRWQHPREGLIGPAVFLPDAERTGLLPAITAYVLDTALAQCSELRRSGVDLAVSVNLSVRNLLDLTLADQVADSLAEHAVPAHALELEVTETTAMTDPVRSVEALASLRATGVSIAIDDYGTGYSSLAYLQSLPVQTLKIDQSFVGTMQSEDTDASIVSSTIELARSLGMRVVAEGVEDIDTLDALRELGCDGAQGYYIGRPMPAESVAAAVRELDSHTPTKVEWMLAHPGRRAWVTGSFAPR